MQPRIRDHPFEDLRRVMSLGYFAFHMQIRKSRPGKFTILYLSPAVVLRAGMSIFSCTTLRLTNAEILSNETTLYIQVKIVRPNNAAVINNSRKPPLSVSTINLQLTNYHRSGPPRKLHYGTGHARIHVQLRRVKHVLRPFPFLSHDLHITHSTEKSQRLRRWPTAGRPSGGPSSTSFCQWTTT
jgi:hypothetical protein